MNAASSAREGGPASHDARSRARLAALQALYQLEITGLGPEDVIEEFIEHRFARDEEAGIASAYDKAFFSDLKDLVDWKDVANGVFKSFCFAIIIGVVSCHQGLSTIGGPRGIGRSVTKAVVNSIVLIVVFDYLLTRFLQR